jgi:SAM-dependent methyltransferase
MTQDLPPAWLLDLLQCPSCGETFPAPAAAPHPGDGRRLLHCRGGHSFTVQDGISRFVAEDQYTGSFSFEWKLHRHTQFDARTGGASTARFRQVTGMDPHELRGKIVLDAGVGAGRFADVVVRAGARVVGIDLSLAVESAHTTLARFDNAAFVQGDLLAPPFRPGAFDFIYSIGVLHHTPDAEGAFRALVRLLKPGGTIAIYVYSRHGTSWRVSDLYRRLTSHLPHRLLYALCYLAVPLYHLERIPLLGPPLQLIMPISMNPGWRWRVLDTFDWYAPRYQSKHTYPEVYRWFREAGLIDIELMDSPICARGRIP